MTVARAALLALVCGPEGGVGDDCEFVTGGTTGRLTQTASAVTLFAGSFNALDRPQSATLTAHRTNGTTVASASVPLSPEGFTTALTVASPAADIDSFTLTSTSGDLGFDDLTLEFPGGAVADITASAPSPTAVLLQGHTTNVPVQIGRLNGSSGPVCVTATGLPPGVSATASPNPVGGERGATTLRFAVSPTAPDSRRAADPAPRLRLRPGRRPRDAQRRPAARGRHRHARRAPPRSRPTAGSTRTTASGSRGRRTRCRPPSPSGPPHPATPTRR